MVRLIVNMVAGHADDIVLDFRSWIVCISLQYLVRLPPMMILDSCVDLPLRS
jgi:hypothetical protein